MSAPPAPGLLVVIDGLDGAGKSTLIQGLARHLDQREVVLSREPTYGAYGRQLRDSASTGRRSAAEEIALFELDRAEHVHTLIRPALDRGAIVILDRYYYSSVAYQAAFGPPEAILARFTPFAPVPDLGLILDLPVPVALERIHARGAGQNDFEHAETLARCRERFQWVLGHCPETRRLDADRTPEAILAEALGFIALAAAEQAARRFPDATERARALAWLLDRR